jgi:hypothetical protein
MPANRAALVLVATTGLVVLLAVLFFTGGFDLLPRPPESSRPESSGPDPIPEVVPNDGEPEGGDVVPKGDRPRGAAKKPEPSGVPLTVVVVEAETGRPVSGALPRLVGPDGESEILPGTGGEFRATRPVAVPGQTVTLGFEVDLPEPYGLGRPDGFRISATISRYARSARVEIPVWTLVPVLVTVLDHRRDPVAGAQVTGVTLAGATWKGWAPPTDAAGKTRWLAVPAIRGEWISVSVRADIRRMTTRCLITDAETPVGATVILPRPVSNAIGIGGGAGGAFGGRGGHRNLRASSNAARGAIEVLVRRANGRPAADTLVVALNRSRSGRTDARGRLLLSGLVPGVAELVVREPGFAMGAPVKVTVVGGRSATATVVESTPGWTTVEVLDRRGKPLPGAAIDIVCGGSVPWVCLDGDVQLLNLLTGPDGRVLVPFLPPAAGTARATYGSRRATASVKRNGVTTIRMK